MGRTVAPGARRLASMALAALLLGGCLVIPVPHQAEGSRGTIGEARAGFLRAGVTTREDVLLALGEPDDVLDGERILVYRWERALTTTTIIIPFPILPPMVSSQTMITARHRLRIEFDAEGLVRSVERSELK